MRSNVEICGKEYKLVFEWLEEKGGYGYSLWALDKEGQWRQRSAAGNPLLRGASFGLYPSSLRETEQGTKWQFAGTKKARATSGEATEYGWDGYVRYDKDNDWLEVNVAVRPEVDLQLDMNGGVEPEITIDMGGLPPYDRGDHVWFKTSINNPTKWNDEAYGNDFPAMYYYDSYFHYDVMMFFDMTAMSWMSRDNVARFLNYRCGFRRRYKPGPAHELGLYADGFSGTVFPAGEQQFAYYIKGRTKASPPKESDALHELVDHCLQLVPAHAEWPDKATDWEDFTQRCTADLMDPQCWNSNEAFDDFILNYVNGYSPAWQEAFAAKKLDIDFTQGPCIDSAAWIGFPLTIVNALKQEQRYGALLDRILRFTSAYLSYKAKSTQERRDSGNAVYREGISGTWQYVYILEQIWQVAWLNKDEPMLAYVDEEVREVLIPLARNVHYLFPLAFDMASLRKYGNGDGYMIAGLYANFMVNLYKTSGDEAYLQEAERALKPLIHMPVNSLSQEAFLFTLGLQAAAELWKLTGDAEYKEIYAYLVAQNLRMMYWYDDNTRDEYKDYNIFAMFQACTPIIYPAFFENIECLARLASTFDAFAPTKGLLRVFNHARKNNMYMFPQCLPENRHSSSLKYIPYENVGVLEDEKTGWIGQEIYGCGQVYEAYLMWEAFAKCDDRDVMALNLNNYKWLDTEAVHSSELLFVVYNPEPQMKEVKLDVSPLCRWSRAYAGASPQLCDTPVATGGAALSLRLAPDEAVYIKLQS